MYRWVWLFALLIWSATSGPARADWASEQAQFACNSGNETFEIRPYQISSKGGESPDKSFTAIDHTRIVDCSLGNLTAHAKITIHGPDMGQCEGSGWAWLSSLSVSGVELLTERLDISNVFVECSHIGKPESSYDQFDSVKLRLTGALAELYNCTSRPNSDGVRQVSCNTQRFDINALKAAQDLVDHHLDPPEVQRAESATLLPPSEDEAKTFGMWPVGSAMPLCIHTGGVVRDRLVIDHGMLFPSGPLREKGLRYGRVAGAEGDRVAVYRSNPMLGLAPDEDGGGTSGDVSPGDRIIIERICDGWSLIALIPRVYAVEPIVGWVETSRLYGLDPFPPQPLPGSLWYTPYGTPIAKAAAEDDIAKLRGLLAGGVNVNVPESAPGGPAFALQAAISTGAIRSIDLLLQSGADPNMAFRYTDFSDRALEIPPIVAAAEEYGRACVRDRSQCDPSIVQLLLERGADPNATSLDTFELNRAEGGISNPTAMDVAAFIGSKTLVRLLLTHGAKAHLGDSLLGDIPARIAEQNGHPEVAKLLWAVSPPDPLEDAFAHSRSMTPDQKVTVLRRAIADPSATMPEPVVRSYFMDNYTGSPADTDLVAALITDKRVTEFDFLWSVLGKLKDGGASLGWPLLKRVRAAAEKPDRAFTLGELADDFVRVVPPCAALPMRGDLEAIAAAAAMPPDAAYALIRLADSGPSSGPIFLRLMERAKPLLAKHGGDEYGYVERHEAEEFIVAGLDGLAILGPTALDEAPEVTTFMKQVILPLDQTPSSQWARNIETSADVALQRMTGEGLDHRTIPPSEMDQYFRDSVLLRFLEYTCQAPARTP